MLTVLQARAAETWLEGNLSEVTTVGEGLLIRMDNGQPTQCAGTPFGTRAYTGIGYCTITQVDPAG